MSEQRVGIVTGGGRRWGMGWQIAMGLANQGLDLAIAAPTRGGELSAVSAYPVTVRLERLDPGHEGQVETVKARLVAGCDGARSAVRGDSPIQGL